MRAYQPHIFIFLMSSSADSTRPEFDWDEFERRLRTDGKVLVQLHRFYALDIKVNEDQRFYAYFGTKDKMQVDDPNKNSLRITFETPLFPGPSCSRVSRSAMEKDFFMLPSDARMNYKLRIPTGFLQRGKKVKVTENVQFMYKEPKAWSPEYAEGTKFTVVRRNDDTGEIMLEPEGGGPIVQLHLTNARFLKEIEKSPENVPASDGVSKSEVALASEVKEMKALLQEQSQRLDFQEQEYQALLNAWKTSLTTRNPQGTAAREFQEQAQLLTLVEKRYRKLFATHQRFIKRRITEGVGASKLLPSSIIKHLSEALMCPFLADRPAPSDTGVLQNGQLVSRSSWNTYVSKLPEGTTPICPLTREEITQKKVIKCPSLQFLIEVFESMDNEQQKKSADVHDDEGPSQAKRRKL